MATTPTGEVLQHLRRIALLGDGAGMTDGQLLEAYIRHRDEAGFAALVRRHGPMVWGVCCRVLGNHQDAEDAFQATFLVLVRRASAIVPRDMVGRWLYGVARQTALKARATAGRRNARERQVAVMPEPAAAEPGLRDDLLPLLDQELGRLPEKYRAAVVLCDLGGKSYKEAARQLGWPEGTLAARLARARALLAKRLRRHGLAVSGATLAAELAHSAASAGVPTRVLATTIQIAATGGGSAAVAALTEGVLKAMLLRRLMKALGALLAAGILLGGVAGWRSLDGARAVEAAIVPHVLKPADRPADKRKRRVLRWVLHFNTKDGKEYAKQLEALGASLAFPAEAEGKYQVIRDLSKRPVSGAVEDLSKVDHIFWLEDNERSIASLAKALGLKPAPKQVIVFLPKFVEDELLRKELAHARARKENVKEENITETQFDFVRTEAGYDIKVASQHIE
jgi:RNA polymerase sigma factor (sigma-70 family)